MLSEQIIQDAVERIVRTASAPSKVIVFGSYGRGDADERSDLDLMVIEREVTDEREELLRLAAAVGRLSVDVDLLVYTEREFEQRKNWCSTPVYWAAREGRVLYECRA